MTCVYIYVTALNLLTNSSHNTTLITLVLSCRQRYIFLRDLASKLPSMTLLDTRWPESPVRFQETSLQLRTIFHRWRVRRPYVDRHAVKVNSQGRSYGYIHVEAPNYLPMHRWWNGNREAAASSAASSWGSGAVNPAAGRARRILSKK